MKIKRVIVIENPIIEPDTKEAVQTAALLCEGLEQAANFCTKATIEEMRASGEEIDEKEAMDRAGAFKVRVMKINVAE